MKLFISIQILVAWAIGITPSAHTALSDGIVAAWTFDDGEVFNVLLLNLINFFRKDL